MTESVFPGTIDSLFSAMGVGSLDKALVNNIYGINHMQNPGMVKSNRDHQGYVFMTRPQLNLQPDNIRNYRELYPLLNNDPKSLAKAIRMLLDPRIGRGYTYPKPGGGRAKIQGTRSVLMDDLNAFIPMVTNNIVSISGWPDVVMETTSTDPGLHNQVYSFADGMVRHYGEYDLSVNLRNVSGDPASLMLHIWLHYMTGIKEGKMMPYWDHIVGDRIDYQSRIYRVVLNEHKTHVTKIFSCIAGFPTSSPTGMFADFNNTSVFSEATKELSFRFKAMGFVAYDPLLIKHFNDVVEAFNPHMLETHRSSSMIKLEQKNKHLYNHRAYPRIDPETMEMQWWVNK